MKKVKNTNRPKTTASEIVTKSDDLPSTQNVFLDEAIPMRFKSAKSVYDSIKKSKPKASVSYSTAPSKKKKKKLKQAQKLKKEAQTHVPAVKDVDVLLNDESLILNDDLASENERSMISDSEDAFDDGETDVMSFNGDLIPNEENLIAVPRYDTLEQFDYILGDQSSAMACVPFSTCFYFKGRLKVTIISGTAEILGYAAVEDAATTYDVYSPRGYSLLCIRSVSQGTLNNSALKKLTAAGIVFEENELRNKIQRNVLILLQKLDNGLVSYLDRVLDINVLKNEPKKDQRKEDDTGDAEQQETPDSRRFQQLCDSLDSNIILRGANFRARFYQEPDFWDRYTRKLLEKVKNNEPTRLLLCGGKGVGKSTLLRYIVNRLLKECPQVLVLDFDPGQAEFTPAGFVSANIVSRPLLGPNFSHLDRPPVRCYFIGDVDITSCPQRYVESCTQLLDYCRLHSSLTNVPMIINTMGFTKGLGLDVALDQIRLSRPTRVLEIKSRSVKVNFSDDLKADYVASHSRGWLTGIQTSTDRLDYEFDQVFAVPEESEKSSEKWGLQSADLRRIGLLSYFSRMSTGPQWTLSDTVPYRISWSQLSLCVCHEFVPPSLALSAINSSLVALCSLDPEAACTVVRHQADHHPTILQQLPAGIPCLGYGVVRCIDYERHCLYLLTPEPPERLSQVNCLVMGGIQLPEAALLDVPLPLRKLHGDQNGPTYRVPYAVQGPSANDPSCRPYRSYKPVFSLRAAAIGRNRLA